jgi:hypothetical protein
MKRCRREGGAPLEAVSGGLAAEGRLRARAPRARLVK